jgi:hypothetical protein
MCRSPLSSLIEHRHRPSLKVSARSLQPRPIGVDTSMPDHRAATRCAMRIPNSAETSWLNSLVTEHDLLSSDGSLVPPQLSWRPRLCSPIRPAQTMLASHERGLSRQGASAPRLLAVTCTSPLNQRHCRCSRPTRHQHRHAALHRNALLGKGLAPNQRR